MSWWWPFKTKSPEEIQQELLQKQTLDALRSGGIPLQARERIEREKEFGAKFFSSDLTAREFLLAKENDLQLMGQVMGTSFYNVSYLGQARTRTRVTGELVSLSGAHLESRKLAVSRMLQEAQLKGASGVVGVKINANLRDWTANSSEFTAVGTAVKIPGYPEGETFVSALSVQDFWKLYTTGYMPAGVVMGMCSYYVYADSGTRQVMRSWSNAELPEYTNGLNAARHTAMKRMHQDMAEHGAEGVVGMDVQVDLETIEYDKDSYKDMIAHFMVFGTSVKHRPDIANRPLTKPLKIVNLNTPRQSRQDKFEQMRVGKTNSAFTSNRSNDNATRE